MRKSACAQCAKRESVSVALHRNGAAAPELSGGRHCAGRNRTAQRKGKNMAAKKKAAKAKPRKKAKRKAKKK
jgi:hypothetical protein